MLLVQNFFPKLRDHLLSRIQAALQQEAKFCPNLTCANTASNTSLSLDNTAQDYVFFKCNSIYQHKVLWFNFTTYDMQHRMDIVNPGMSRCNIMLLADHADSPGPTDSHYFLYAQVLSAHHANVIYTGPRMWDHDAHSFDFSWVRWYEIDDPRSSGWNNSTLDLVHFPPIQKVDPFGFVDPDDVLWGCYIIPAFAKGKCREAQHNVSRCAKDSKDYMLYYVGW